MRQRDIFIQAVQIEDAAKRCEYLDAACASDPQLRQAIDELLAEHERETDFILDSPPPGIVPVESARSAAPGSTIGPYKIRELIGEGGMGEVYVAEQKTPVRRRVALKIIKPGMASRDVVSRFEAERQALALMDHPYIAHVYDGGVTETGQPYFVMELISGLAITEYCDERRLTIGERLQLCRDVCNAIQHAHQKGIIHRDIKPSNVLVSEVDGAAIPKVIDFGIAKAVNQRLSEQSVYTRFAQMIGTPQYMSPEQAGLGVVDIDTRSDVYSLGVLLYELLTGDTPFPLESIKQAGFDQWRNMILEREPQSPSARLSTLDADVRSTVAERRRLDMRRVSDYLSGELDWIVMKTLEKDRNRRYDSAGALAADIDRYLKDEPVLACPPSHWYRLSKALRRHRLAWSAAALVAVALIAGTTVSLWQARRAGVAEQQAESRNQLARSVVDEMYTQVAEKWLDENDELTDLQQEFLQKALGYYEDFSTVDPQSPEIRIEVLRALERVGSIQARLGDHAAAETSLRRMITESTEAVTQFPDRAEMVLALASAQSKLAELLLATGQLTEASEILGQAQDNLRRIELARFATLAMRSWFTSVLNAVCTSAIEAGRPDAEAIAKWSLEQWQELVRMAPESFEYQRGEAIAMYVMGMEAAKHRGEGSGYVMFSAAEQRLGDLLEKHPRDQATRFVYSQVLGQLSRTQAVLLPTSNGSRGPAEGVLRIDLARRSLAVAEGLVDQFPNHRAYRALLVEANKHLADELELSAPELVESDAIEVRRKQLSLAEELLTQFPDIDPYRLSYLTAASALATSLRKAGHGAEAGAAEEQAYHTLSRLPLQGEVDFKLACAVNTLLLKQASQRLAEGDYQRAAQALALIPPSLMRFDADYALRSNMLNMSPFALGMQVVKDHTGTVIATYQGNFRHPESLPSELKSYDEYFHVLQGNAKAFAECKRLALLPEPRLSADQRDELIETCGRQATELLKESDTALQTWLHGLLAVDDRILRREVLAKVERIQTAPIAEGGLPFDEQCSREAEAEMCRALICAPLKLRPVRRSAAYLVYYLVAGPPELRDADCLAELLQQESELLCGDQYDGQWKECFPWALMRTGDWIACLAAIEEMNSDHLQDSIAAIAHWHLKEPEKAAHYLDEVHLNHFHHQLKIRRPQEFAVMFPDSQQLMNVHREAEELLGPARASLIESYYSQSHPDDPAFNLARAEWHQFHGRHRQAVDSFTEALQTQFNTRTLRHRAFSYCQLNELEQARADIATMRTEADEIVHWYRIAPIAALAGDEQYYQEFCRELASRFDPSQSPLAAYRITEVGLLQPGAIDLERLPLEAIEREQRRLERFFSGRGSEKGGSFGYDIVPWREGVLALLALRRGEPSAAIDQLQKARDVKNIMQVKSMSVLAMAHHQLGNKIESRDALEQATQLLEQAEKDILIDYQYDLWYARRLFAEATAVCGQE